MWFKRKPKPDPADAARGLREQALTVEAAELGLVPSAARPHVWGILMETGYPEAVATLVVLADGTTSLYFSNGGGVIGAGEHAVVRTASDALLAAAEAHLAAFAAIDATPLPDVRRSATREGGTTNHGKNHQQDRDSAVRRLPVYCAIMRRTTIALVTLLLTTSLAAQQPTPAPPPNQVALAEAREHAKAGRTAEAIAALERVTPPAPAVLNQLRTSDDFKPLRDNPRFQAIVAKLTPCQGPQYKGFDFWLGDWEVRNAAGNLLGHNRITKRHGGCVVLEEWESAGGGSGSSFNVYDQQTKQWHQFWVDATGTNWLSSDKQGNPVTLRGGIRDGAMVLSSHPDTLPSIGLTRTTWRPLSDGGVRQTIESSSDGGKTWTVSFDGFYKKPKS